MVYFSTIAGFFFGKFGCVSKLWATKCTYLDSIPPKNSPPLCLIGKIQYLEPIPHQISKTFWSIDRDLDFGWGYADEDKVNCYSRTRSTITAVSLPGCTLENPSSAQLCDACGASRPTGDSAKANVFLQAGKCRSIFWKGRNHKINHIISKPSAQISS